MGCRLPMNGRRTSIPASPIRKIFFWRVPGMPFSSRNENDVRSFGGADRSGQERAELRLRVLRSLPTRHQRYLVGEIRKLCNDFLRSQRVPSSEMTPEELLSEVWQKLLGAVSVQSEERSSAPEPTQVSIDANAPERDGRVVWLIDEIGGAVAMAHRREDILRRRFGRGSAGNGRRLVQSLTDGEFTEITSDADAPRALEAADGVLVWRGLLATAALEFGQSDDVSKLLNVLAEHPETLQECSGGQWPITDLVVQLNNRFPPRTWTRDRVDNAKRRLLKWIKRLMRQNGLDEVDLEALFARVARQQERGGPTSPNGLHRHINPQNG